jgi:hypothetical protein
MKRVTAVCAAVLLSAAVVARAAEPPDVLHQPSPCTVPDQPPTLCANVTDDGQVANVRLFFRPAGDKFYSFVEMAFGGLDFCGTLPSPRAGKVKWIEYYVQAVDNEFESRRTSTYQLQVQPVCDFPPVEKDPARIAGIKVFATNKKQGDKLPDKFVRAGVSFVPVAR